MLRGAKHNPPPYPRSTLSQNGLSQNGYERYAMGCESSAVSTPSPKAFSTPIEQTNKCQATKPPGTLIDGVQPRAPMPRSR
eukprot:8384334-Heterocapsa_arctica.AAC.1